MGLLFRRGSRARHSALSTPAAFVSSAAPQAGKGLFRRLPWKIRFLVGAPLFLAASLATVIASLLVIYTLTFPDPLSMHHKERTPSIRILARDDSVLAQRGGGHDYMPLDLLPPMVIAAVVATEDRRFNEHWGLDPAGMFRAAFANLRAGRFAQGGSTLTQQLAKNLYLSPERTMARKLEEIVLALWLELRLSKREILELYLNRVYFGGGAYGIEAASQRYFDKSARELSIAEAAVIAGLLKAPSKYSPASSPEAARARGRIVLANMREAGVITPEQERSARAQTVDFIGQKRHSGSPSVEYAVDFVLESLPALVDSGNSEVIVETTLDADLQRKATDILQKALVMQGSLVSANQAAITVLDADGGIRALVGGRSFTESQFNRAVKARRQPGSAFKPFVYLAALEAGHTPDSVAYDLPLSLNGWSPHNDSGKYMGAVTLRDAISHSINTVAVRLLMDVGANRVAMTAKRLGIESELRQDASLALGTSEVSLLELSGAYVAFANGGRTVEPHAIRRVRMSSGRVLYARPAPATEQSIAPAHVAAMNAMLYAAMTSGTGRRAAIPLHPAAGKTGTSQEFRDAWFVGYTAYLTAGVWIGNDNGQPMNKVRGGNLPAEIWRDVMRLAHAGKAPMALSGMETGPFQTEETVASAAPGPGGKLPWLAAMPQPMPAPRTSIAHAIAPGPSHPRERIEEDFIARALADDAARRDNRGMATIAPAVNVGETEERDGKLIVRPPPGIMSLGGMGPGGTSGMLCNTFGLYC